MILIADVQYGNVNWAAGILYQDWQSKTPSGSFRFIAGDVEEYTPGEFYRRELPALLTLVEKYSPSIVVIDGYVDLPRGPGLGRHLHNATGLPVLGIAKKRFEGVPDSWGVLRGKSEKPLWVTAIGVDNPLEIVRDLPGRHRRPDWVVAVDQLARFGDIV